MKKSILLFAFSALMSMGIHAQQLAFPGAEGYGAYATGGRGGNVVHVTNLNATGAGSLADAVSKSGRIVVFDVGGVIDITGGGITIASNVTIAGQTAPGEGITIYGGRVIMSNSSNVVMRYIRMRGGISLNQKKATLTMDNCNNCILDHCSISWGRWDDIHIANANNITFQYCIVSEGIDPQRFGAITDGTRNWTVTHCLWANNKSRNPKMKCYIQYVNNVVYNYGMGIIGGHSSADNYQDVIANYFITGPSSGATNKYFDQWTETDHLYSRDNYTDGNNNGVLDGQLITDYNGATAMQSPNFNTTHPLEIETAAEAYQHIVDGVGASRVRDIHDRRIIEQLTSLGTKGAIIDNESQVGGIGTIANGTAEKDTDGDGMPDAWETANGCDPNKADATSDVNNNGFNNIEDYVNSLAQKTTYIMAPGNLAATTMSENKVKLTWTLYDNADSIMVETSTDGKEFTFYKCLPGILSGLMMTDLDAETIYYFRIRSKVGDAFSNYSNTVSIHDEFMRGGGGTPAGVSTFTPEEGMFYRIINYATIPYNKATTNDGTPKYFTFTDRGALGTTEDYTWNDTRLIWQINKVEGGYTFRRLSDSRYISGNDNVTINGEARIGASDKPDTLTITHTGDVTLKCSGSTNKFSLFRINSPKNNGYQIRAKGFADNWFWGSGPYDRADMVYTFAPIEASRLGITPEPTAVKEINGYSPVVSRRYYSIQGTAISKPVSGTVCIQVEQLQNGEKRITKHY